MRVQFLETFIDCDFAYFAYAVHVALANVKAARLRYEVDNARGNRMRRIFRNELVLLNSGCNEQAELGELGIHI